MKVLHFILGKANKDRANGVNQVIAGLAKYCTRLGAEVRVIGKAQAVAHEGERIARDGFMVEGYSQWSSLRQALGHAIQWADIVHLHGVYSPLNLRVGRMCEALCRPYVVTLHNGLAPELARMRSRFRKAAFHALLQRRHLANAAAVHVLAEEEATDLFSVARPPHVFCIPNGLDLDDVPANVKPPSVVSGSITIGFLGRLSPEKNLQALCDAFLKARGDGVTRLKLAGPESAYSRRLVSRYGERGVEWVGPKFGPEKFDFIRSVDLFVLPSLAEVFSIAAMEVLAVGTPLLITRTSKAAYFNDRLAFFMCEPTVFGLERGLRNAVARREDWTVRAANGRRLVEERLNWSAVADDLLQEYRSLLGRGSG